MSKVSIIGARELLQDVMDFIYRAGVLHIESVPGNIKDTPFVDKLSLSVELKKEYDELERLNSIAKKTINITSPLIKNSPVIAAAFEAGVDLDFAEAL